METVSIITPTARREPGFQMLADSIVHAGRQVSGVHLEWIVVDGCQLDQQRRQALEHAIDGRIPFVHISPKPTRWQGPHRLTKSDYYALCNARNTGLIVANGQRVILLDDCTVVDDHWLARHLSHPNMGVAGAFCTYQTATVVNGKVIKGDFGPYGWDHRIKMHASGIPCDGAWAYGLNTSFPLEWALRVNGFDELYDGQGGSEDNDLGLRAFRAGLPYRWDPGCVIYQILGGHATYAHEELFGHAGWGREQKSPRRPKELVLKRDGKSHFANEKLIEQVIEERDRTHPLGNPFSLSMLREKFRKGYRWDGGLKVWGSSETTDWRDGQALGEMT